MKDSSNYYSEFQSISGARRGKPTRFRAPGRVNLIGEHTDYNGGLVLPMAIDRYTDIWIRSREDSQIRLYSENLDDLQETSLIDVDSGSTGTWADYILGLLWSLDTRDYPVQGFDAFVTSTVPLSAGLSSSAALEVAGMVGLNQLWELNLRDMELVEVCQQAENDYVGANTGIMDQTAAYLAREGTALLLNVSTREWEHIDFNSDDYACLVVDTLVDHSTAGEGYSTRRSESEKALELINQRAPLDSINNLSAIGPHELDDIVEYLPAPLDSRVRHVVEENQRVTRAKSLLQRGDWSELGELFFDAHRSFQNLYEASAGEADFLVEQARELGALGARLTGGGFGGSTIHIISGNDLSHYRNELIRRYKSRFGKEPDTFVISSSDGAKRLNNFA